MAHKGVDKNYSLSINYCINKINNLKDFFLAFQNHINKPYLLRLCDILLSPCEVFVNW